MCLWRHLLELKEAPEKVKGFTKDQFRNFTSCKHFKPYSQIVFFSKYDSLRNRNGFFYHSKNLFVTFIFMSVQCCNLIRNQFGTISTDSLVLTCSHNNVASFLTKKEELYSSSMTVTVFTPRLPFYSIPALHFIQFLSREWIQ